MKNLLTILVWCCLSFFAPIAQGQTSYNLPQTSGISITDLSGNLYDHAGPTGDYANSIDGWAFINPGASCGITLNFSAIAMETCCDWIFIYEGEFPTVTTPTHQFNTLATVPTSLTFDGAVTVRMTSDGSVINTGFAMTWQAEAANPSNEFTISDINTPANTPVYFTVSEPAPTSQLWDFGDGTTSTEANPSHTYAAPGTYTVTYTATSCLGGSVTGNQTLTVQELPEADITPLSISETTPYGNIITNELTICNTGAGEMQWSIDEPLLTEKGLQVLALVNGADATNEYAKTKNAINAYFTDYVLTELTTYDAATLSAALENKDILLIPEQEDCNEVAFAAFAPIVHNFVNGGGTVILLGTASPEGTGTCIFELDLLHGEFVTSESGTCEVILPEDPLLENVTGNYVAQAATFKYNITDPDYVSVIELNGDDLIGYRPIGAGRVVLIGHDYSFANNNMKKVISNAVRQANDIATAQWLFVSENEGTLAPGACATVDVQFDGEIVYGGYYQHDMIVYTNDSDEAEVVVNCTFDIQGLPSFAASPASLTFVPLMVGDTAEQVLTISNNGTDSLYIYNIVSSSGDITTDLVNFGMYGGGTTQEVIVTFAPSAIQTITGSLVISTNLGNFTIPLSAEGLGAPAATVNPTSINVTLNTDETQTVPVVLNNSGEGPMTYSIDDSQFDGTLPIAMYTNGADGASVTFMNNLISTSYPNAQITPTAATSANQLATALVGKKALIIPPIFDFAVITSFGTFQNVLNDFVSNGGVVIFAQDFNGLLQTSGLFNSTTSFNMGDMVSIEQEHPISNNATDFFPINGCTPSNLLDADVEVLASQPVGGFGGGGSVVAYRPIGAGYAVYLGFSYNFEDEMPNLFLTNTINWIVEETLVLWLDLSSASGNLGFPDQETVNVTLDATDLLGGVYTTEIVIQTNDPLNETITVPVTMTVVGVPQIEVNETALNFGNVVIGNTPSLTFTISNPGTDNLNISSISSNLPEFTSNLSTTTLEPYEEIEVTVTFDPAAIQSYNGVLTINNNVSTITIPLTGAGLGAPAADITPGSVSQTLMAGDDATAPITLSNSGAGSMAWEVLGAGTIDVLMYNVDVDVNSASYTGLQDNLAEYVTTPLNITTFDGPDVEALEAALVGKEIVIVPSQLFVNNASLSSAMGDVLETYVNNGGKVLFVGNSCQQCVTLTGLWSGFFSYSIFGNPDEEITFVDPNSPFVENLDNPLLLTGSNYIWSFNGVDVTNVANGPFGNTAIAYRNVGDGSVVYIPNDFSVVNDANVGQLLVNALNFSADALPTWLSVSPASGTTPNPGNSTITLNFNADNMLAGTYTYTLTIATNDPLNPTIEVPITLNVLAFPQANFSPSATLSCDGMVLFTDESLNNPTSWTWDFGDGTSSTQQNPVHTYENAGTYTVSLNACNSLGCDDVLYSNLINVNFDFVYCDTITMPSSGAQQINTCNGVIRDPGGEGQYTNGLNSTVTIAPPGSTQILLHFSSLQVETCCDGIRIYDGPDTGSPLIGQYNTLPNGDGEVESTGGSITIEFFSDGSVVGDGFEATYDCVQINDIPNPDISYQVTSSCQGSVQFTDESNNFPDTWLWNFGDGTTSTEENPLHSYTQSGTYQVSLQACNFLGCQTETYDVTVEGILNINFTWQNNNPDGVPYVNINSPILFQDQTAGAVDWQWDFGNGNSIQGVASPISFYTSYGVYDVTLTVTTADGCERTITKTIIVVATGIDQPTLDNANLQVMPNPTNNKAQVTLQLPKADKVNLRVFDAVGKQVYQHNSNTAIQNYQHQLDFSDMPRGMYLISLQTSEGMISRQLIVQ